MNSNKICALQEKYTDQSYFEVKKPEHKKAVKELLQQQTKGLRTILGAPYQEQLTDLDMALIGVRQSLLRR